MDESDQPAEPTAACADDLEKIRALTASVRRERDERIRLEQAGEEVAKLVHALNNALSIVSTFSSSLSDELEADHPARESVEEIQRAAKRAIGQARKIVEVQRRAAKAKPSGQGRT
jgi:predicted  nucleic acid-binding Zn-ribbon protein